MKSKRRETDEEESDITRFHRLVGGKTCVVTPAVVVIM